MSAAITSLRDRLGASVFGEIYGASALSDLSDLTDALADLSAARAEVDGAASVRYALPVSGSGALALVDDWTLTLASERAYTRSAGSEIPLKIKDSAAQVRKYLELLRDGQFRFPDAPERLGGCAAFAHNDPPVFGRDNLNGF